MFTHQWARHSHRNCFINAQRYHIAVSGSLSVAKKPANEYLQHNDFEQLCDLCTGATAADYHRQAKRTVETAQKPRTVISQ